MRQHGWKNPTDCLFVGRALDYLEKGTRKRKSAHRRIGGEFEDSLNQSPIMHFITRDGTPVGGTSVEKSRPGKGSMRLEQSSAEDVITTEDNREGRDDWPLRVGKLNRRFRKVMTTRP